MFTVKAFHRGGDSYHAYEASQYTSDSARGYGTITFQEPGKPDSTVVCLSRIYERIVVENAAGRTVENIAFRPGVAEVELGQAHG